jgi:hypothetical protein
MKRHQKWMVGIVLGIASTGLLFALSVAAQRSGTVRAVFSNSPRRNCLDTSCGELGLESWAHYGPGPTQAGGCPPASSRAVSGRAVITAISSGNFQKTQQCVPVTRKLTNDAKQERISGKYRSNPAEDN